jgi:hypothetical protein
MGSSGNVCGTCVPIVIIALTIIYIVWGSIILNDTNEAVGECNQVWIFSLVSIILSGISFCMGGISEKDAGGRPKNSCINSFISCVFLGLFIWGCIIYGKTVNDNHCMDIYHDKYPDLWTLFIVVFWFDVAVLCLVMLIFILACCCSCGINGSITPV